jgi:hypothetical protein
MREQQQNGAVPVRQHNTSKYKGLELKDMYIYVYENRYIRTLVAE